MAEEIERVLRYHGEIIGIGIASIVSFFFEDSYKRDGALIIILFLTCYFNKHINPNYSNAYNVCFFIEGVAILIPKLCRSIGGRWCYLAVSLLGLLNYLYKFSRILSFYEPNPKKNKNIGESNSKIMEENPRGVEHVEVEDESLEQNLNLEVEEDEFVEQNPNLEVGEDEVVEQNPNLVVEEDEVVEQNPNLEVEEEEFVEQIPNLEVEEDEVVEQNPNFVVEVYKIVEQNPNVEVEDEAVEQNPNLEVEEDEVAEQNPKEPKIECSCDQCLFRKKMKERLEEIMRTETKSILFKNPKIDPFALQNPKIPKNEGNQETNNQKWEEILRTEREFHKNEIKNLKEQISDLVADLYEQVSESEFYKKCLETKLQEHEKKVMDSTQEEMSDLAAKLYVESTNSAVYAKNLRDCEAKMELLVIENNDLDAKLYHHRLWGKYYHDLVHRFAEKCAALEEENKRLRDKVCASIEAHEEYEHYLDTYELHNYGSN